MRNLHRLVGRRIPFATVCSHLQQLLDRCGQQVPPEWTVADLVVAVTGSPRGFPEISNYDSLDLFVSEQNALLYLQVNEFIHFLNGTGPYVFM